MTDPRAGRAGAGVVDAWWIDVRERDAAAGHASASCARRHGLEQTLRGRQVAGQALRRVLAEALSLPADELHVHADERGRPRIFAPQGRVDISLSRSCGRAVAVLSESGLVGVDVECTDRALDHDAIARRFFSVDENEELDRLTPASRRERFFELWTWKEAVLKAAGLGLSAPLPTPEGSAEGTARIAPWMLRGEHSVTVRPEPGYVVTVVASFPRATIRWHFGRRPDHIDPLPSEDLR